MIIHMLRFVVRVLPTGRRLKAFIHLSPVFKYNVDMV